MNKAATPKAEIERIARVADMLCTGHAALRDRYSRRGLLVDIALLGMSTWLLAITFVDPTINASLTPSGVDPRIWVGGISATVFFLSLIQMKTDWKGMSDAHRRALDVYSEVKREARYVLSLENADETGFQKVLHQYNIACAVSVSIPEREFIRQKRRHKLKLLVSKHLDEHPSASITLLLTKFWLNDNFSLKRNGKER